MRTICWMLILLAALPAAAQAQKSRASSRPFPDRLERMAEELLRRGAPVGEAAQRLSREARGDAEAVLHVLVRVGFDPSAVAEAGVGDLRRTAVETARVLRDADVVAAAVARGFVRSDLRRETVVDALLQGGFPAGGLLSAMVEELQYHPGEAFEALEASGTSTSVLRDAVMAEEIPLEFDCLDAEAMPVPCGNFGGGYGGPAMGQVTWTPQGSGYVRDELLLESSDIPPLQILLNGEPLQILAMDASRVRAVLPSFPTTGPLVLRRVSDGVEGLLDPSFEVLPTPGPPLSWMAFGAAAYESSVAEFQIWLARAEVERSLCTVQGPLATAPPGVLRSTGFQGVVRAALEANGAPEPVARAWERAVEDAANAWAAQVRIPSLPLFPSLAAVPQQPGGETVAPPVLGVPFPLLAFSPGGAGPLSKPALKSRLLAELGSAGEDPLAVEAIDSFATLLSTRFAYFLSNAQVFGIKGGGPVPELLPLPDEATPAAPVVNGWCFGEAVLAPNGF